MPDHATVIAITSGVRNMQSVLNLVWEHLLPGLHSDPLPADEKAQAKLEARLASLQLRPQSGAPHSYMAALVSGNRYELAPNDKKITHIHVSFGAEGAQIILQDDTGEHVIACGKEGWLLGHTSFDLPASESAPQPVAASGAWTADDTYTIRLCFRETPFISTLALRFAGDRLELQRAENVGFGPPEGLTHPLLIGQKI
jgi:hypothetical protein